MFDLKDKFHNVPTSKFPILSYFKSIDFNSIIFSQDEQKLLIEISNLKNDSSDDEKDTSLVLYGKIIKLIDNSNPLIEFESKFFKAEVQSNPEILFEYFEKVVIGISSPEEYGRIFKLISNKHSGEQIFCSRFFLMQIIHFFNEYINRFEGQQKIELKKEIDAIFKKSTDINEHINFHILIDRVLEYFNNNETNYNKNIFKYLSLSTINALDKNLPRLIQFVKSFYYPFITQEDEKFKARFIEILRLIIKEFPKDIDSTYVEKMEEITKIISNFVDDLEQKITPFAARSYLLVLRNINNIISVEFKNSTENIIAELDYLKPEKRFPLSNTNNEFELPIQIYYKQGSSQAADVHVKLFDPEERFLIKEVDCFTTFLNDYQKNKEFTAIFNITPIQNVPEEVVLNLQIKWKNILGKNFELIEDINLKNISSSINWHKLRSEGNPYSLNAVEKKIDLVGRENYLEFINQVVLGSNSTNIFGQKRVGKTSIANCMYNEILNNTIEKYQSYIAASITTGEYVSHHDPAGFLAFNIALELYNNFSQKREHQPQIPEPNEESYLNNFSRIILYLKSFKRKYPDLKFVIFIDEFDEIPEKLFTGEAGNNFFQTLRSLAGLSYVSLVIIGGEKIPLILSHQGTKLNFLDDKDVDYFDPVVDKKNIEDIINYPIIYSGLEFTPSALNTIIEYSAGNPYYIIYICRQIYSSILRDEISSIGTTDVVKYFSEMINKLTTKSFNHFWSDGKIGTDEELALWGYRNSRILIALSNFSDFNEFASLNELKKNISNDEYLTEEEVVEFVDELFRRKVICKDKSKEKYKIRVKLLNDWLKIKGKEAINQLYKSTDYLEKAISKSSRYQIAHDELKALEKRFSGFYSKITISDIERYLNQYYKLHGQRGKWLAFKILQKVRVFSRKELDRIFKDLFGIIENEAGVVERTFADKTTKSITSKENGVKLFKKTKYQNIMITKIDSEGKSGSEMVKIFQMSNSIIEKSVLTKEQVVQKLIDVQNHIVIFVDDFIGTGESAVQNLNNFFSSLTDQGRNNNYFYYCVVCGTSSGISKIEDNIKYLKKVIPYSVLSEDDKAFAKNNDIFNIPEDLIEAENLFNQIGLQLEKKNPLGFGDCQSLIVFHDNAPNNTLPALIKEKSIFNNVTKENLYWEGLFIRR